MKVKLLFIFFITVFAATAQTTETYDLDWFTGIGNDVDLTIETGDTVTWTWTSPNHTVENNPNGTSEETFDSGLLQPNGSVFSYTFTLLGSNDYYCGIHGANSMSGTITVLAEGTLSSVQFEKPIAFSIYPNPSVESMKISLPSLIDGGLNLAVFDILGKQIYSKSLNELNSNINISKWNAGIYLVRISSSDESISLVKRFVKR
ncbi:T9SS type A sorting domain-containing protein [Subsaximicrobium wynnwilliamsii]|jgi:hypothetical protein|uniref:T9SS type A sorting domain-containing protein n=1 Tax=Subsaximicrobium wynnwilliamsii TaxID=291179 RepID=A0A5C6ZE33_9FLAO|nr:T9SS type A sorting domain-containing protein [Subsaximicrobium wynnwilliamsii]TXD83274.1 T9SS type A sorting domain-containing protein [Subsaximicrobium wynnwilliamsii]TXD87373.1 T9SS type A sorting domain-containing protein [Subsaximicrobium wynnwilliamsii]TXE03297.1 T9SS type A sorting domain-containing protein [Subsaximicrobium wynnwilliamsii]